MNRNEAPNEITGDLLRKAREEQKRVHYEQGHAVFEMVSKLVGQRIRLRNIFPVILSAAVAWIAASVFYQSGYDDTQRKLRQYAETIPILIGTARDEPSRLVAAEKINEYRRLGFYGAPHDFTFKHYNERWRDRCVDLALELRAVEVLRYFTEQDGWGELVSEDRRKKVDEVLANPLSQKSRDEVEHSLAVTLSKKNALLAWYHDNPKYLAKVDFTHLNERWVEGFEARVDKLKLAPKVEAELFNIRGMPLEAKLNELNNTFNESE